MKCPEARVLLHLQGLPHLLSMVPAHQVSKIHTTTTTTDPVSAVAYVELLL